MATRIKRDKFGKPIRNEAGLIIRTKPNTLNGLMVVIPDNYSFARLPCGHEVWGMDSDIDSGIRKHIEYCEDYPQEEIDDSEMNEGN